MTNEERKQLKGTFVKGQTSPMKDRKHTSEAKQKMSVSRTGIKQSQETIDKRIDKVSKKFIIITPHGKFLEIQNMRKFCRENNLDCGHMIDVTKGNRKQHRGYKASKISQ